MQNHNQPNFRSMPRVFLLVFLMAALYACSTASSMHAAPEMILSGKRSTDASVSGYVVEGDGATPLYNATVAVLGNHSSIPGSINDKSCPTPAKPHVSFTCTREDGSFSLDLSQAREFPVTITIEKLDEIREITLELDDLNSGIGTIAMIREDTQPKEKVAVVMDFYNPLQEIQEFLDANPSQTQDVKLQLMNEYQNLFEINGDGRDIAYPTFYSLFIDADNNGQADIFNYDVVYINSRQKSDLALLDQSIRQQLVDFISNGGNLNITEWSVQLEKEEPSLDQYI
ncbi:MAG: hypothetical protein L0Z73_17240 [Gammaproteobacteria bacterium]|nr:hypothetical protein [Gammaproteobacteria bacterium]